MWSYHLRFFAHNSRLLQLESHCCYIWYSKEGPERAGDLPSPLLAVPNVTAHPSTMSVPTSCYSIWQYLLGCPSKFFFEFLWWYPAILFFVMREVHSNFFRIFNGCSTRAKLTENIIRQYAKLSFIYHSNISDKILIQYCQLFIRTVLVRKQINLH